MSNEKLEGSLERHEGAGLESGHVEIERKYRIQWPPVVAERSDLLEVLPHEKIEQFYIGNGAGELRVRRITDGVVGTKCHIITIKGDGTLSRTEWEQKCGPEEYQILLERVSGRVIKKTRFTLMSKDGITFEVDIYEDYLKGLIIVEVEFPSVEAANAFRIEDYPAFAGAIDVTDDKRYKNKNLRNCSEPPALKLAD